MRIASNGSLLSFRRCERIFCPNTGSYPLLGPELRENPAVFLSPELRAKSEILAEGWLRAEAVCTFRSECVRWPGSDVDACRENDEKAPDGGGGCYILMPII
jgi:hypothetical protein